jgi:alpha-2-macroglobulin
VLALDRQVSDGLKRLYGYQHDDGGWGWWKTDPNHPFMTAYALDGLLQARDAGAQVETWRIPRAATALKALYAQYPRAIPDLKAYEVYAIVRAESTKDADLASGFDAAKALDELWSARERMTASGRALLLMTLDLKQDARGATLARELVGSAQTRGDLAWWPVASDPLLQDIGDTSVEATALVLKALSSRDARDPLLEQAARWLVVNRSAGGYWFNTKQTALALEGLLAYMQARGEKPAPLAADVFVNGALVRTVAFDEQSLTAPDPIRIEAPAATGTNTIRIVKRGTGALYYDAAVRYYDKPAASERTGSRALALTRSYALLSPVQVKGRIVYREGAFDGTARPGDLILVRLTVAGSADWQYLMLEDPIPAGTEPVEKADAYALEQRHRWYWGAQRELRDDRVVFFLSNLAGGRYESTYLLKVTTPGVFGAMPARIAPMYVPDTSASSTATVVTVSGVDPTR